MTSQHQGPGAIDLIIALTAVRHGMSVLHDDRDFGTIAGHGDIGLRAQVGHQNGRNFGLGQIPVLRLRSR